MSCVYYVIETDELFLIHTISLTERANPGGGKEIIDEYLERTKDEVEKTEPILRSILGYLNLDVLPPSK